MSDKPVVMVVDDQPDLIDGVKLILEVEGYEVWTAANGQHALDKLESTFLRRNEQGGKALPDLVLSDIMMPVMDGYTLFERVKANPYLRDIPFIFLTAKVDDVDIRRGKELGVDDYLTKPSQPDDLLSSIRGKLKRTHRPGQPAARVNGGGSSRSKKGKAKSSGSNTTMIIAAAVLAIVVVVIIVLFLM